MFVQKFITCVLYSFYHSWYRSSDCVCIDSIRKHFFKYDSHYQEYYRFPYNNILTSLQVYISHTTLNQIYEKMKQSQCFSTNHTNIININCTFDILFALWKYCHYYQRYHDYHFCFVHVFVFLLQLLNLNLLHCQLVPLVLLVFHFFK